MTGRDAALMKGEKKSGAIVVRLPRLFRQTLRLKVRSGFRAFAYRNFLRETAANLNSSADPAPFIYRSRGG